MNILIAMFPISQLGGIVNHTENLIYGFRELGHNVDLCRLVWSPSVANVGAGRQLEKYDSNAAIYPLHQLRGWAFPRNRTIPYMGKDNIARWKKFASKFDIIIWQTPVPGLQKTQYGNMDWLELYDIPGVKNIAVIHDPHFQKRSAHMINVSKYFAGAVCVHTAALNSVRIDIPKVMILNPHAIDENVEIEEYGKRKKGFLAAHYFKKIKRMDDLVKAIPYMDDDISKVLAGDGIEYHYMVSKEKCRKIYKYDDGTPIWNVAEEHGMKYLGMIHPHIRDKWLRKFRTSVDPSYHIGFARYGAVFNRSPIESIIQGAIVCAVDLGISGSDTGNGFVWKATGKDKNYIAIPYNSNSEKFAGYVNDANNLTNNEGCRIQENALSLLDDFDRKYICQQYIDFAIGKGGGYYNQVVIGKIPNNVMETSEMIMNRWFRR